MRNPATDYLLAIDQGTSGTTVLAVDRGGKVFDRAYHPLGSRYPRDGWVEQDAGEIFESALGATRELLDRQGSPPAGIGITNQRETTLVWDRASSQPLAPAIVWQDRRTAEICQRLREQGAEAMVRERTGLLIDPYFSGTKLAWMFGSDPDLAARARSGELCFGTVDSWLVFKLTGGREHVIDATNAGRTMLARIDPPGWDDDLLELLGVPRSVLPRIVPSAGWSTLTDPAVLGAAVPLAGIAGDQHAALFGQACFEPGQAKTTYGTGCFVLLNAGSRPPRSENKLLSTLAWQIGAETTYALEGSVFMGGATVQWLRDNLGLIEDAAESEAVAASVPDSGGTVLVPAFTGLGAPDWDPDARAAILGMTRDTRSAHIVRAGLESIALQVCDVLSAMSADTASPIAEMRVDGGAAVNNLLMQMQADYSGMPVIRPAVTETTGLGAALLAGLTLGWWPDLAAIAGIWERQQTFEPDPGLDRDALLANWRRAVKRSMGWAR